MELRSQAMRLRNKKRIFVGKQEKRSLKKPRRPVVDHQTSTRSCGGLFQKSKTGFGGVARRSSWRFQARRVVQSIVCRGTKTGSNSDEKFLGSTGSVLEIVHADEPCSEDDDSSAALEKITTDSEKKTGIEEETQEESREEEHGVVCNEEIHQAASKPGSDADSARTQESDTVNAAAAASSASAMEIDHHSESSSDGCKSSSENCREEDGSALLDQESGLNNPSRIMVSSDSSYSQQNGKSSAEVSADSSASSSSVQFPVRNYRSSVITNTDPADTPLRYSGAELIFYKKFGSRLMDNCGCLLDQWRWIDEQLNFTK